MGGVEVCAGLVACVVMSAIPIAMITLGALHYDECPMQPWIPKFMIVSGAVTLAVVLFALCAFGASQSNKSGLALGFFIIIGILALFLFAWQIAGSVWVFKEWKNWDNVKDSKEHGCHNDTYLFAFAILIIFWISCPCQGAGSSKARE
ncbi:uncharacterized protein LOC130622380 [Hydractinia symbiolongicarpus]|uniref:uncharacterized protein LOC130622380 n=1 Tax=Hydractinia symbiolongicarpus TaxID=13093 RepID=UPI00254DB234|nr:uncharacterized protein LOC130622380 [Hydractinia symbiolongicarpus]